MVHKPEAQVLVAAFIALSCACRLAVTQPICFVEWSISNSYTIASSSTSYVTLNLYASNNGTEDLLAPYNLTIYNPAYVGVFSWNFEVTGALDGVITGETLSGNAFWETLLAGSKNVVNMGGNVETEELGAQPLEITIGGYRCQLSERLEGERKGTPGSDGSTSGSSGGSAGSSTDGAAGGSGLSGTGVTQQGAGGSASGSSGGAAGSAGSSGRAGGVGGTGSTNGGIGGSSRGGSTGGVSGNGGVGGSSGVDENGGVGGSGGFGGSGGVDENGGVGGIGGTGTTSGTGKNGSGTSGSGFIAPVPGPAEPPLSPLTSPMSAPSPSV